MSIRFRPSSTGGGGGGGSGPSLSDSNPSDLGVASPGSSSAASRADHVHKLPTAAEVGAAALTSDTPAALGTAAVGVATTAARADHVHPLPAPQWRRLTFSNADYNLGSAPSPAVAGSVVLQQTGTLNATRTVTLPAASAVPAGGEIIINAGAGASGTNTVTIARAGSDTINGAATSITIGTAWGQRRLVSDGVSAWAHDDGLMRRSQNLADLASASTARSNLGAVEAVTASAALWIGTQAAYDALGTYPSTTLYVIT